MLKNKAKKKLATFYRKSVERKLRIWIKNEDEIYISCESKNLTSIGINILNIKFWNHKKVLFSYAHFVFQKNKTPQCYQCIHAKHILFIKKTYVRISAFLFFNRENTCRNGNIVISAIVSSSPKSWLKMKCNAFKYYPNVFVQFYAIRLKFEIL